MTENSFQIYVCNKHNPGDLKAKTAAIAALAGIIWREHYTPIIGAAQVEYMLKKFQSAERIYSDIMSGGYTYFIANCPETDDLIGYCGVAPKEDYLLLSKIYIRRDKRGKGIARAFLIEAAALCENEYGFDKIRLTANKNNTDAVLAYKKMGFLNIGAAKTDIGNGFFMDDYVFEYALSNRGVPAIDSISV